jgi:uncharacterized membrane protein
VSDLIVAVYRSQNAAFVAGETLAVLQQSAGTEPEDIVVVTRDKTGRVAINQSTNLATGEPLGGGRWGTLIGLMFLDNRKATPGATGLGAQFRATGLDATFQQRVATALDKGGGAVGMRVRLLGKDRVIAGLEGLKGKPTILWTRLSADTEEALEDMQTQIPARVLTEPHAEDGQ